MIGTVHGGRYRILRKLGEGGMGEVYLAEHLLLGRSEALKILRPDLAAEPEFVARFRREARATNRVQHAHIVGVYDFGQLPDGRFFLAMEYAEGVRLDVLLARQGTLPAPRAMHLIAQLADAVDHAHQRGVVHRDLKPANLILIEHRGQADFLKVLDFGIAKIISPEYTDTVDPTQRGKVFGTPAYMAPEQFIAAHADPRSDIYAVGCIGYELVASEPPFQGRKLEVMDKHLRERPTPPSARRPQAGLPPEFDAVLLRCLEKDPARRFQTAAELAVALRQVPGFPGRPGSGPRTRPIPVVQDFDGGPTNESGMREETAERRPVDDEAWAATELLDAADARKVLQLALRELAEALVDRGHGSRALVMALARLEDAQSELVRYDAEAAVLEQRTLAVEQSAREREASLRFAVAELEFERARVRADSPDLDHQIGELGRRLGQLARERDQELERLTDEAISVAARRATADDDVAARSEHLDRALSESLQRAGKVPGLDPLTDRLRNARELARRAT